MRILTGRTHEIVVTHSVGATFRASLPWIGTGAFAGVVFLVGLVLVILAAVRREDPAPAGPRATVEWSADPWTKGSRWRT
jgi:hypothetical protein